MASGPAAATSSSERVPMVDSVKGMPARSAARTPPISPSACMKRVKPVGAIPNGSADRAPAIGVDRSGAAMPCRIRGSSSTASNASRERRRVSSRWAAPSA